MEFKKYDEKSYRIHTIKTNRYKTTRIEVVFRCKAKKEDIYKYAFVCDFLAESNALYPKRRDVAIKLEDMYRPFYNCIATKTGNCLNCTFFISFINPEYIEDEDYTQNIVDFLFDMLLKPNIKNKEFNIDAFNIVKKDTLLDIESISENPEKMAINNALKVMDSTSPSSYNVIGTKEDVEKLTPQNIYSTYEKIINEAAVDIFICGNTDMDPIVKAIKKRFVKHQINEYKEEYYITNKAPKKLKKKADKGTFLGTQLVMLYSLENLTREEKELTFHICNYILGSGGLSSKLYRYIREENSYCYAVSSMYYKYDNLLCIALSLAKENVPHAIKLAKKAINEMAKGDFTEDDLENAKQNLLLSLEVNRNNPFSILSSYEFKEFLGNYDIEEKIAKLKDITKKDIVTVARKIKENTIYELEEAQNENN